MYLADVKVFGQLKEYGKQGQGQFDDVARTDELLKGAVIKLNVVLV